MGNSAECKGGVGERVIKSVDEQFGLADEDITTTTRLREDLGADSLDCMELVMEIESEFRISIGESDIDGFVTVGDVITYVEQKVS